MSLTELLPAKALDVLCQLAGLPTQCLAAYRRSGIETSVPLSPCPEGLYMYSVYSVSIVRRLLMSSGEGTIRAACRG